MKKLLRESAHILLALSVVLLLLSLTMTTKVSAAQDLHVFFETQGEPKSHGDERGKLYDVLWGYKDGKGNVVIEPKFAAAGHFYSERAFVRNVGESKYSIIDTNGNEVTSERYISFYTNMVNDKAIVSFYTPENTTKYAVIDKNGKHLIDSAFMIYQSGNFYSTFDRTNNTGNIYNAKGKALLKNVKNLSQYSVHFYEDGFILSVQGDSAKKVNGFYNAGGKKIISPEQGGLAYFDNCIAREDYSTNKVTLYTHKGKKIKTLAGNIENGKGSSDGLIIIAKHNLGIMENYYVTQKGKVVKTANSRQDDLFAFIGAGLYGNGKKYTLYDANGKTVKTFTDNVSPYGNGLFKVTDKKGKIHVVNSKGKTVIKSGKYDTIAAYTVIDNKADGTRVERVMLKVTKGNKQGLIDENGKVIIPVKYDQIETAGGGFLTVKQNGKYGLMNVKGKEILPFKYDRIYVFGDMSGMAAFGGNHITASVGYSQNDFYDLSGKLMGSKDSYSLNSEIF